MKGGPTDPPNAKLVVPECQTLSYFNEGGAY